MKNNHKTENNNRPQNNNNKNIYKPENNQPNYGGRGGGVGGGRVNPMNLINNVINNHPANERMVQKYGDSANLGPDGHVGGRGGFQPPEVVEVMEDLLQEEKGVAIKILIKKEKIAKVHFYYLIIQMEMALILN